jgi:sialate O-acetylesterase
MEIKDSKAIIHFYNVPACFSRMDGLVGFEIAGEDKIFHIVKAKPCGVSQIEISSDEVAQPIAVRYCFRNFEIGNVYNSRELLMVPFRTDNW